MLICEELLLVLTSPAGKVLGGSTERGLALAGAALCELTAAGRVTIKSDRLVVLDTRPSGDAPMDHALEIFARKAGKKPERVLPAVARGMTGRTYQSLVAQGAVRVEPGGFLRFTRHPVVDVTSRDAIIAAGARVLFGTAAPDLHTRVIVGLLGASDLVTKAYRPADFGTSGRRLRKQARAIGAQDWAAGATAAAIESTQLATKAAMIAATTAAATAASNSS
ncbi:GOLPH3/VPS74 family protein [Flexivirga caeni]|uniref:GPP34 family phosphoprotein n=1 Tax=Flexivirga caeni TaxID=2294115 RepID=A0A3M9M6Y6_9MICO|nr:GPP34 family phosphoprotein [Flexivirga caeni]RNI20308.1 GPP34 family phosphoprotein [Flexivirga caeni]